MNNNFKSIDLEITISIPMKFSVDYFPERSAPACNNPSSPRFSDCGDSEEMEIVEISFSQNPNIRLPLEIVALIIDKNYELLLEEVRKKYEEIAIDKITDIFIDQIWNRR